MAVLQDLIAQIEDSALRERILSEANKMLKQKKFGLVFEEHLGIRVLVHRDNRHRYVCQHNYICQISFLWNVHNQQGILFREGIFQGRRRDCLQHRVLSSSSRRQLQYNYIRHRVIP